MDKGAISNRIMQICKDKKLPVYKGGPSSSEIRDLLSKLKIKVDDNLTRAQLISRLCDMGLQKIAAEQHKMKPKAKSPTPSPAKSLPPTNAFAEPKPNLVTPKSALITPKHNTPKIVVKKRTDISIKVSNISQQYINSLRKEQEEEEAHYTLKQLVIDIEDAQFVLNAVNAELQCLLEKLKIYTRLEKLNFDGVQQQQDAKGIKVQVNEKVNTIREIIKHRIEYIKSYPDLVHKEKKRNLLDVLDNPISGIKSIKGKSREGVRNALIKVLYMFMKVPSFFVSGFFNFMITGSAGSGKTKVATVMANMLSKLGVLASNKIIMATRQNMVGEFIGQTAVKTKALLAESIEGVLFLDEAYSLTPCPGEKPDQFSSEAVAELINFMDKFAGCYVTIVAGYKGKMYDCFLAYNEGMARRFPRVIDLLPYSSEDMFDILVSFINETIKVKTLLDNDKLSLIFSIVNELNEKDLFVNQAGDMLNLAKMLAEDAVLHAEGYNEKRIKLSFKKFMAAKNIAIEF